jgi:hypothetical protein
LGKEFLVISCRTVGAERLPEREIRESSRALLVAVPDECSPARTRYVGGQLFA